MHRSTAPIPPEVTAAVRLMRCTNELRDCEQLVLGVYSFSRRLAETGESGRLHQEIVDTIAMSVGAQQAALATYSDEDRALSIVATRGYPAVLVEDLRIPPGSGIIGAVFASREPMLVEDVTGRPGAPPTRRLRYRTTSFMALPLVAGGQGLGVVSLADRADGRPFSRRDLTTARALAAPAVLALSRERLAAETRELAHAAAVDSLTGLFNRRYFETRIEEEIQRARRYTLDLALLIIDADDFKEFNDRLGHLVGDTILRAMADLLRRSVRAFDVCTRFGGEEFAILMPGGSAETAVASAERIRQRVADHRFEALAATPALKATISIGVATLAPDEGAQDLIGRADRALYAAKSAGKNRVRMAR